MSYTTTTEETKQHEESKFIAPGIHEVKITKIEAVEPEGKAPYLNLTFENTKGQTTDDKLYFSPAATELSQKTLGDIKKALGVEKEVQGDKLADFAKNLSKVILNKQFRHRFTGEEIQGKMGDDGIQKKNWFKAKMGRRFSCESISVNPSRLKPLDKTNQYDWKTLPTADVIEAKPSIDSDLPF